MSDGKMKSFSLFRSRENSLLLLLIYLFLFLFFCLEKYSGGEKISFRKKLKGWKEMKVSF
jgi:hypothetical protein